MALNYRLHGVRPYSCTYTNPGAFTVPPEMAEHIRGAEVILGQATVPRCHCASISYGDTMEITFAGTQAETDTERDFLCARAFPCAWRATAEGRRKKEFDVILCQLRRRVG